MTSQTNDELHFTEEALIAYQMHESPGETVIRFHLEQCNQCSELADAIAETLRVFSGEPVPEPDLERNWQRLRGSLRQLARPERRTAWQRWLRPALSTALAGLAVLVGVALLERHSAQPRTTAMERSGPLSEQPRDPAIAHQLESAERLLTAVNHTPGALDVASRQQAHELRLKNAFYIDQARSQGDPGAASVLEGLDHVLTDIDHDTEPKETVMKLRVQWNTKSLLLDIRILRQNDAKQ